MNKAILIGRLVKDPELTVTQSGISMCKFTLAVDRPKTKDSTEKQADFLPVVAWRQQAEFVSKYFRKGSPCVVVGSIKTGSYEAQDGTKRYTTDIIADSIEFVPKTTDDFTGAVGGTEKTTAQQKVKKVNIDDLEVIEDDSDLPF
ncbi:MAG: single-stranded DNA-binding protein [Clostridia bacterium]